MTLRIRDWNQHFENNRTRELKELRFVILPNKHDGDGYTELLDHPNGAAHYGAWVAIVQVASKCDPRGTLLRDCRTLLRDGAKAHDFASLSRLTRFPEKVFKEAVPRLLEIGWLEELPQSNQEDSVIPQEGAGWSAQSRTPLRKSALEGNRIEGNRIEEKDMSRAAQAQRIFDFWRAHLKHPKAILDGKRRRAIEGRLKDGCNEETLIAAVRGCRRTPYNMGENPEHRIYDDIELICRDATHVERFAAQAPEENGRTPVESPEQKRIRESCLRCHGTRTELVEGKGARPCDHKNAVDFASS